MTRRRYSLTWRCGTIAMDGPIGPEAVSAAALRRSLRELEDEPALRVLIRSPGGACDEGLALFTLLREAGKPVAVTVREAASMAAVIAMAGTTVDIVEGGTFYLHDAGCRREQFHASAMVPHMTAGVLRHVAGGLERIDALHVDILARRTGLPRSEIVRLRREQAVIGAEQAVALGLADRVIPDALSDPSPCLRQRHGEGGAVPTATARPRPHPEPEVI